MPFDLNGSTLKLVDGSDAFSTFKETDFASDSVALALRISEPGSNSTANLGSLFSNKKIISSVYHFISLIFAFVTVFTHLGCPVVQEWCRYTPAIHAEQLILGFMCIAIGYAFTATMSTSTMTQVLPPGQQVSYWSFLPAKLGVELGHLDALSSRLVQIRSSQLFLELEMFTGDVDGHLSSWRIVGAHIGPALFNQCLHSIWTASYFRFDYCPIVSRYWTQFISV